MEFEIREMHPRDFEPALALWKSLPGIGVAAGDDPESFERFLTRNPGSCFVAWLGETLCGTIMSGHDGRRAFLYHAAVKNDLQGKGLGKLLLDRALAALQKEGIAKANAFVLRDNDSGRGFWEHVGAIQREDLVLYQFPLGCEVDKGSC